MLNRLFFVLATLRVTMLIFLFQAYVKRICIIYMMDNCVCCFFSGLIVPEVRGNDTVPEVGRTFGYAPLHFFSDAAYNLTSFNIFYL